MARYEFNCVPLLGHSLEEYERFCCLTPSDLTGLSVLDCPSGVASFAAKAASLGIQAVAADPLYLLPIADLKKRAQADLEHMLEKAADAGTIRMPIDQLRQIRQDCIDCFFEDLPAGRQSGRYVAAKLPDLPFGDASFDLVLSGHFLLEYGEEDTYSLDYEFHIASLVELLRVSRCEVRVYPIRTLASEAYPYADRLIYDLRNRGVGIQIVRCEFEIVEGLNQTMILKKPL